MSKNYSAWLLLLSLPFLSLLPEKSFASGAAAEYLCELGAAFYGMGRYDEALGEFNKALIADPDSAVAKSYINDIFRQQLNNPSPGIIPTRQEEAQILGTAPGAYSKEEAMNEALLQFEPRAPENRSIYSPKPYLGKKPPAPPEIERGTKIGPVKVSGEMQMSFGVTPQDFIWKRANFDMNEKFKSWRMTSDSGFNRRFNTYDPAVYDQLKVNVDTDNEQGFNFHTNLTVDPWSFTGKSNKTTVTGSNGDTVELQAFYWSNTGYTVNNTAYTSLKGDTINMPEIKVKDGATTAFDLVSNRNNATFNIPSMKLKREFQPLRELWLDYANDQVKLRVFPMGYQNQAYTSDDPLVITNHGIWWKDSKWLRQYTPGTYNTQDIPVPSYTKGRWDDSLSFLAKDSTGQYLTALRGFAFNFSPDENTTFDTTVATPKNLWQDYGALDNAIVASRLKHYFSDNFMMGATFTNRSGFIVDKSQKLDSLNFVSGVDLGYEISDGLKAQAEILTSQSKYDMSNSVYETDANGQAYYFSFITRYPYKKIMDLKYGYDDITMDDDENYLLKSKFYLSRMDRGFDSALSDFHNTRQDVFWSRHIHFRRPLDYYYAGLDKPTDHWEELNSTRIGDGIDSGRSVLGYRFEIFLEDKFANLFDVRNVHDVNGKFIENVARDEMTVKVTDKLTAKGLGIYQKLPKTTGGIDPFIYDGSTGNFFKNDAVADGMNPTIKTGSLGLNYDLCEGISINGIYERTNDYTLAYGDFPRNVLRTDTTLFGSYFQDSNMYRFVEPLLYNQGVFPQAPYEFYNVFKCGLRLAPAQNLEIYLDYTRNEFEAASLINDSMNHMGMEIAYMPTKKTGMLFKYIYSRSQNIDRLQQGITEMQGHHNFFSEFRYLPSRDDQLIFQYGVGDYTNIGNLSSMDPYGGSMLTLDTQHIIRVYYRRKF